jgi:recombination protein RecA
MSNTKEEPKKKSLNRIIAEINKKNGDQIIGRIKDLKTLEVERIQTKLPVIDDALGGGFPMRRIIELYGLPSGGKSLISMLIIKSAQEKGLECVYVDVEDSFDPKWAKQIGVDTDKLIIAQSMVGEDTMEMVCTLLAGEPAVIVVDSVAAMIPRAEQEEKLEKPTMALKARLMSRGLAKINSLNKNTLIVFINQIRATMALYGAQTTTTGGRSLGHYASIRMEVKKGQTLHVEDKKTKPVIGQIVNFYVTKNKTAPPFKTGSFKFYYDDCRIE